MFTKHDLPLAKRRDNFAEKESRNPKDDTAYKTISLSKKKQIQKVIPEWIKQLGGNSPKAGITSVTLLPFFRVAV
ncbi:hypothetical protein, partial [Bacteroides acidifaciens]|uniref:hypothetical protein n=1 Tax=Bacteroides acidifaciens TaxID=85831 RepID=UPI0025A5F01E